jgi:hypothetical protein
MRPMTSCFPTRYIFRCTEAMLISMLASFARTTIRGGAATQPCRDSDSGQILAGQQVIDLLRTRRSSSATRSPRFVTLPHLPHKNFDDERIEL